MPAQAGGAPERQNTDGTERGASPRGHLHLGKIDLVRVFNQKGEGSFPMAPDSEAPAGFDWDMWNGPAPERAYNETLRNQWRYLWRYSGGDMHCDGVHQVDLLG